MSNPFGITEVDIPGALGAYEAGQTSRVNRLLRVQQLQQAERQAERDANLDQVIARVTGQNGKGAAGAYSPAAQPNVGQQVANGITSAVGIPAAATTAAPPQSAIPELSQQDELALRLGGERGVQIATAIRGMNDQQKALTNRRAMAGGQLATQLQAITDPAQRAAVFQRDVPLLLANGYTQQEVQALAQEGFSNEVLARHAQTADLAARFSRMGGEPYTLAPGALRLGPNGEEIARGLPRYYSVTEGGDVRPAPSDIRAAPPTVAPGTTQSYNGRNWTLSPTGQWEDTGPADGASAAPSNATAPAFSANVPLTLEDRRSQYPSAPGRAGPQGPRTFR